MFEEPRQFVRCKSWKRALMTFFDKRHAVPFRDHGSDPCYGNPNSSQPRGHSRLTGLIGTDQKGSGRDRTQGIQPEISTKLGRLWQDSYAVDINLQTDACRFCHFV